VRRNDFWPELGPTKGETDRKPPVPGTGPAGHSRAAVPILEPLVKEFRDDLIITGGFDVQALYEARSPSYGETPSRGAGHNTMVCMLTGAYPKQYRTGFATSGGPSVDQFVGRELQARHGLPFAALTIGVRASSGFQGTVSWGGVDHPGVTPENDPVKLWRTLFAGRNLPGASIDKIALRRKSVLDYLAPELTRFGARFGGDDKRKIDAHLQSVRDLERQLQGGGTACTSPAQPMMDFSPNDMMPAACKAQAELLHAAFKCDLTRAATFNFENTGGNNIAFSWLGPEFTGKGDEYPTRQHHDIAHNFFRSELGAMRHSRVNQWFFEQVAYLCRLLKQTPEGAGTMLDNTAVVVLNSMGQNHAAAGLPCAIVGSCGGYFKTGGRLVRAGGFRNPDPRHPFYCGPGELGTTPEGKLFDIGGNAFAVPGVPINRLLVSLANAMDVPVETFGERQYGGELTELRG
jgi:hypothetical protein